MKKRIFALLLCISLIATGFVYVDIPQTVNAASTDAVILSEDGLTKVEGNLPKNAVVEREASDNKTALELVEELDLHSAEYYNQIGIHDISVVSQDEKWQPDEQVMVTLDDLNISNGEKVEIYHILDDEDAIQRAIEEEHANHFVDSEGNEVYYTTLTSESGDVVINADGSVSFATDSFSIFIVKGYNDKSEMTTIANGATVEMKRGEVQYFKWEVNNDAVDYRGTWVVESGNEYVDFEVYNSLANSFDGTDKRFAYYWLKVTAKAPSGENVAKLRFDYWDKKANTPVTKSESFFVKVTETEDLMYVDNQIPQNGCLVPVFVNGEDSSAYEYVWTRSDGAVIDDKALVEPYAVSKGAINVAIDKGGVDPSNVQMLKTYTVVAIDKEDKEVARASFTVKYGNEVINGGFEFPKAQHANTGFANGTKDLFWATTAPAEDNLLGWDVEYLSTEFTQDNHSTNAFLDTFGIVKPAVNGATPNGSRNSVTHDFTLPDGGTQLAEINGSGAGALYQDVLSYPGTELYWSIAHRARNYNPDKNANTYWVPANGDETKMDTMYVIIAPTEQVEHIRTQDQLDALISAAGAELNGSQITRNVAGHEITYSIQKIQGDHTRWRSYNNNNQPYVVGDGDYLVRYFFAAGPTIYDRANPNGTAKYTVGNLIDDVSFNDDMPYRIEYYLDGNLQANLTETGKAIGGPTYDKIVEATKVDDEVFQDKHLLQTKVNGRDNDGKTCLEGVYSEHNVLQLYYVSYGVSVEKEVEIEGYNQLTSDEKALIDARIDAYEPTFELREVDDEKETTIATVEVDVNPETMTGTAEFKKDGKSILLDDEKDYKIVETEVPDMVCLRLTQKASDSKVFSPGKDGHFYTHEAKNEYDLFSHLTINKLGTSDLNQGSIFRIKGTEGSNTEDIDLTVTTQDNGVAEIKYLPLGKYTVTELTDWSWRYELEKAEADCDEDAKVNFNNRTIELDLSVNYETTTFTNKRVKPFWLSGDSFCENWWINNKVIEHATSTIDDN